MNQKGCNRWSERETKLLEEVRVILADEIAEAGQFAEVVGDRGIMKFIRGHGELDKIVTMYRNYLHWRKEVGADAIRERIRLENLNKPSLFPNGEGFLEMSEQIIIAADACDLEGNPIAFETFDFSPRAVLKRFTIEQWDEWMVYTLLYKLMVLEQVSEERERALLREHNGCPPCTPEKGYGIILQCTGIRCMKGLGMEFLGSDSKAIMKSSIKICQDNFPEMLHKSHVVNAPWIFNTLWYFCKGFLDARTIAKVNVHGYTFLDELCKEIPITSIPKHFGGKYMGNNDPFEFDWAEGGLMDLAPELKLQAQERKQQSQVQPLPQENGNSNHENGHSDGGVMPPSPPTLTSS